ncbi:S1 family peptidase [Patulibacter minatonensis]|uniref:S1 family peptidase n=1 Tax=Patulibacter minatonensis TaxID=298163 RepID=UPI0006864118|nr:trypsin-like serine protease [Patulibacter minatonensis]
MTLPRPRPLRLALCTAGALVAGLGAVAPAQSAEWRTDVTTSSVAHASTATESAPASSPRIAGSTSGPGSAATPRIVGGTTLPDTTTAPYTVAIQTVFGDDAVGGCSGTILDATHVLTAAHCVVEENGTRATPDQVAVASGTTDATTKAGLAQGTVSSVATIRVHPRHKAGGFFDDVAVLTLSAPLNLADGKTAALPMAPSGTIVSPGRLVRITGYGITGGSADDFGTLRFVNVRAVIGGSSCSTSAPGAFLCTEGTSKGACSGDSGGTATIGSASARRLIGVTDIADSNCRGLNLFANVAAPEIRIFIDAALAEQDVTAAQTPLAPRGGTKAKITGSARVGRTVTCKRGSWTSGTKFRYAFLLENGSRQINRGFRSKNTYKLRSADRGRRVFCAVEARSAGGQGIAVGRNVKTVSR